MYFYVCTMQTIDDNYSVSTLTVGLIRVELILALADGLCTISYVGAGVRR
jgi:hypothetical protein